MTAALGMSTILPAQAATTDWTVTTPVGLSGSSKSSVGGPTGTNRIAKWSLRGITTDEQGNVYFGSSGNITGVRKMSPDGNVTTLAGGAAATNYYPLAANDGTGTTAKFYQPYTLTLGRDKNLYMLDNLALRRISLDGAVTTIKDKILGSATTGSRMVMTTGSDGNLYLTDAQTTNIARIWKINPATGDAVVLVGGQVGNSDGNASTAKFSADLAAITANDAGTLYVTDGNRIRSILLDGFVATVSGQGMVSEDGQTASWNTPAGLAASATGNLYTTDSATAREISLPSRNVVVIAGRMGYGGSADGAGSVARFNSSNSTNMAAMTTSGILYVYDAGNATIRRVIH